MCLYIIILLLGYKGYNYPNHVTFGGYTLTSCIRFGIMMWPFSLLLGNVFHSKRWLLDLVDACDYDNVDLMPLPTDGFLCVVSLCRAVLTLRTRGSRPT